MIYLTRTDEEKTKFSLNYRRILLVENTYHGASNIHMDNGKIITVIETEEEINKKIEEFEVQIIRKAIELAKKV